jgi:hypothetical protein
MEIYFPKALMAGSLAPILARHFSCKKVHENAESLKKSLKIAKIGLKKCLMEPRVARGCT